MITDCNLYSKNLCIGKKKNIFINGYQLKHALHVSHLFYRRSEHKVHITLLFWMILVQKTFNSSESTEEQTYMVQSSTTPKNTTFVKILIFKLIMLLHWI